MSIKVLHPGLLTTIQDLGRYGGQKFGIIVSGAMDPISTRIANLLVGNNANEGTLEITMFGTSLQFEEDHLVAITGAHLHPTIDGEPAPMWRPVLIRSGSILQFSSGSLGARAYIAFAGGLVVPEVLGSKSTYLKANMGGYEGRPLQKGDLLTCGETNAISESFLSQLRNLSTHFTWSVNYMLFLHFDKTKTVRILKGSEYERFDACSKKNLVNKRHTLTNKSDRMGIQLEGATLKLSETFELLSEGVTYGTIQVPSSGNPIILMADRQTTGGYPKIGQVITADLPKIGQSLPSNQLKFEIVSIKEAEQALIKQEEMLHHLSTSIYSKTLF